MVVMSIEAYERQQGLIDLILSWPNPIHFSNT